MSQKQLLSEFHLIQIAKLARENNYQIIHLEGESLETVGKYESEISYFKKYRSTYEQFLGAIEWIDRGQLTVPQERFYVPQWSDVIAKYPEINGIHPALIAYPHTYFQYYFEELCFSWRGISDPILINPGGLLLDGRLRLLVEQRFPGESLGPVPFTVTADDPWKVVHEANCHRMVQQDDIGDSKQLKLIRAYIPKTDRTPFYRPGE